MTVDREQFDERHFAEDMGLLFEVFGSTRMAGRILGMLMVAEEPYLSAAELADRLQASSGSVSTATRSLLRLGVIDRVRVAGERRDFFAVRAGGAARLAQQRLGVFTAAEELARQGLDHFGHRARARTRLEEMYEVYHWYRTELPRLTERWNHEQAARARDAQQRGTEHPEE